MSEPTNLWNAAYEASPAGTDLISNGDDEIRDFKKDIRERHEREHVRDSSDKTLDGLHREGSARLYVQSTEPTDRPDGTALDSNDEGRLWYDSTNDILYVWTGTEWEEPVYAKTTEDTTFDEKVGIGISPSLGSLHIEATDGQEGTGLAITGGTGSSFRIWHDGNDVKISRSTSVAITIDDDKRVTFHERVTFYERLDPYLGINPSSTFGATNISEDTLFEELSNYVPNVGDKIILSGAIYEVGGGAYAIIVSHADRWDSSSIRIYGMRYGGDLITVTIDNGGSADYNVRLVW